jgi:hypothetical protein
MKRRDDAFLARRDSFLLGPDVSFPGEAEVSWVAEFAPSVENDPGCVKTLGGITAPGILGPTVMRRAKKRRNLSSARHYDQIRFRFHTTKTHNGPQRSDNGDANVKRVGTLVEL